MSANRALHRITEVLARGPRGSQVTLVVKNLLANAGDSRNTASIPGSGRSPGGGNGNSLQHACLESPMARGAWQATVHGETKRWTWLSTWARLEGLGGHCQLAFHRRGAGGPERGAGRTPVTGPGPHGSTLPISLSIREAQAKADFQIPAGLRSTHLEPVIQ